MIRSLSLALLLTVCALSARAGERIITLGSAATETAFALGAGERVVAVDSSSLWPPAARQRPVVGYYRSLNAEGLLSLRPDHVIGSDQLGPPIVPQQLRAAGVRVDLLPTPDSRQSLLAYFPAFAARLGLPLENAVALQQKIARQLDEAAAMNNGAQPKVLILMSAGHGLMAAGRQTAAALMLELVGASNAVDFSHYKPSSAEALLGTSPDAIVLDRSNGTPLLNIPADSLKASISGQVGPLDLGLRYTRAAAQERVPLDSEGNPVIPSTAAYGVTDLFATWKPAVAGLDLRLDFGIDNLTDRRWRRHLSQFAEAGRNLRVGASMLF